VSEVREKPGIHPLRNLVVKLVAVFAVWTGIVKLATLFDLKGWFLLFPGIVAVVAGLFYVVVGVGLWRYRGWAFLILSVMLLWQWFYSFVKMVVKFDSGGWPAGRPFLVAVLLTTLLIAIFGRWSMERHFRPDAGVGH